jgi:cobyrinic acid a,c-diamide synthase
VWIAGVVLNQVAGSRHEKVLRETIEEACGVPVVGVLPRASGDSPIPGRHLGLVTPEEHPQMEELERNLVELARGRLDLAAVTTIARQAPPLASPPAGLPEPPDGRSLRIGYVSDSAFTFYYPENLEILARAGTELIPVSALLDAALPPALDALYIGGGFPETHGARLAANRPFLAALRTAAQAGLPIYAECGGLMLLSEAILWGDTSHPMAGVLPFRVEVCGQPQGHGYTVLEVDTPNPFFPLGVKLRGHEFHYSRALPETTAPATACSVSRGTGCWAGRDGILSGNVWAAYTHLHAVASPEWAEGVIRAAWRFRRENRVLLAPPLVLDTRGRRH